MRKKITYLYYIILMLICPVLLGSGAWADTSNFYFSDFTGDYYLTKDAEGVSHLKVVESVTAEFPNYNQNKGICRYIPFTNQDGANVTLPSLTRANIKVTRNGATEPIYSIGKEKDFYNVCTGTEEYVLGTQVYGFEYEYEKVVTEFEKDGRAWQELYWDTNGNGSLQRFDKVTARVHFEEPDWWTGESWCYVGKYGESGQERCKITKLEDGAEFTASNLKAKENLTFDMEIKAGSFVVPEPESNYVYVWLTVLLAVICGLCIGLAVKKFAGTREKARYYKGLFVKPEYQAEKEYSLPEMAEVYLGKKKDVKVAMLLELATTKKIEFQKGEKKKWSIVVKSLKGVGEEYIDLLAILNGGPRPEEGDVIKVERHTATSRLIALKKSMETKIEGDLKRDELVENKYHYGKSSGGGVGSVIVLTVIWVPVLVMIGLVVLSTFDKVFGLSNGGRMVFEEYFYLVAFLMILFATLITVCLVEVATKYTGRTMKGLEMSRYMDGLKMYIEMAEADRMEMLQSVKGADTSPEGIVKLYEKLLPYAAVFGLEESWMDEMKEYCRVEEIEEPDYLMQGLAAYEISRSLRNAASVANASTVMSSSGGGSSSGFSGGGGGGFSGGGGGGGGFGGR